MRFAIIEKLRSGAVAADFPNVAAEDLKYKKKLEKEGKIISGGPCLDILADCFILETETLEELGEILFNAPNNLYVEREVHPLGTFADSEEGMRELGSLQKKRK
jgi:hypothetical protein